MRNRPALLACMLLAAGTQVHAVQVQGGLPPGTSAGSPTVPADPVRQRDETTHLLSGTITAVDLSQGSITIDQRPLRIDIANVQVFNSTGSRLGARDLHTSQPVRFLITRELVRNDLVHPPFVRVIYVP